MNNKNTLSEFYAQAIQFAMPNADDLKVVGYNEQGYPIIKSEKQFCSVQFITIDFSNVNK